MALFPAATTNANAGTFADPSSGGLVQGQDYSDPSVDFRLRGGLLNSAETLPMWGGVALYQWVPGVTAGQPIRALGPTVGRATTVTGSTKPIAGFSVFRGNYAWVNEPGSTAPQAAAGQSVNYYPLGSLARIVLACDPALVDLVGAVTNAALAWDFTNQLLIPFLSSTISSGTYNSTTGVVVLTFAAAQALSPGDTVTLSSLTGTGAYASLDGAWQVTAVSGVTVTLQATAALGAAAITGGTMATGTSLATLQTPFNVLEVQNTNAVTVGYNATSGLTNYNFGPGNACALVSI